jgi:anthranilate/para-aminobenzoate synthase component I
LPPSFGPLTADDDGAHHMARVERIRDYLAAGDVYQVNLARRHVAKLLAPGDPLALYAALVDVAPAPYGAVIEADGVTVISGSPERFLASVGDRIETRPIKGTRPRTATGAGELAASTKDAAEHLMIVDLERNDLGRIAETGSVVVDELGYLLELPALYHKVSRVSARPRAGLHAAPARDVPAGRSGAEGACDAADRRLEPAWRGPCCGAIGHFGPAPSVSRSRSGSAIANHGHDPRGGGTSDSIRPPEPRRPGSRPRVAALGGSRHGRIDDRDAALDDRIPRR